LDRKPECGEILGLSGVLGFYWGVPRGKKKRAGRRDLAGVPRMAGLFGQIGK